MTTRRSFLGAILALGAAPAIVRADSLMKIAVPKLILPPEPVIIEFGNEMWSGGLIDAEFNKAYMDAVFNGTGWMRLSINENAFRAKRVSPGVLKNPHAGRFYG